MHISNIIKTKVYRDDEAKELLTSKKIDLKEYERRIRSWF